MVTVQDTTEVSEVLGQKLDTPLKVSFSYEKYENIAEAKNSEDWPSEKDAFSMANAVRKRNAMAAARAKAVEEIASKIRETDDYKLNEMVKTILSANKSLSREDAETHARTILGL